MPGKHPTPQSVSALLKRAGFKRSSDLSATQTAGYWVYTGEAAGAFRVRHHSWSLGAGDPKPHLDRYAKAITEAGYVVTFDEWGLVVTMKKAEADAR